MDWRAVVLVFALIIIDGFMYWPFFKVYEKNLVKIEANDDIEITDK